jgi:Flp pilus assembly protein TadG
MNTKLRDVLADQSGSVALIIAIVIFALLGCAALALDIGHMVMVKSQLQKAADAGALAGARGLWPLVMPVTDASVPRTPNCAAGTNAAQLTAHDNVVDGSNLAYDSEITVEVGRWDYTSRTFTPGCTANSNGVRVTTRRDGVTMFFAKVFGISTGNLSAISTAVQDFAGSRGKGALPICVNKNYTTPGTHLKVYMTPDVTDDAGWFVVPPDSACAATLNNYVNTNSCPPLYLNRIIYIQNGCDASVISNIKNEMDAYHPTGWLTFLPVVDTPQFNQNEPILGFVPFKVTAVQNTTSDKYVEGYVMSLAEMGSGMPGGTDYGTLAPPKLVQ